MKSSSNYFLERHPALYFSLMALCGAYAAFLQTMWVAIPLCVLLATDRHRFKYGLAPFIGAMLYVHLVFVYPDLPKEGTACTLIFSPSAVRSSQTSFGSHWLYQGTGSIKGLGKNFPCSLRLPKKQAVIRPPATCSYLLEGILKPPFGSCYSFNVKESTPWIALKDTSSWAEWRFHIKQTVKGYISRHFRHPRTAEFLSGILTGDFEDRIMRQEFGRAGLQHIMAISGFHFAIIAAALLMILRLILPPKGAMGLLIFLLSSYFLFLGPGPSIFRAWVMSLIALSGIILEKIPAALNSLGIAIIGIILIDPSQILTLGFTFSFAVTAAILIFYSPCKELLDRFIPARPFSYIRIMPLGDQHGYVLISFVKDAIALSLAVNLVALPMTLFYFGKFPVLSLFYNVIIPFMVSLTMLLFIAGLLFPFLHGINAIFTHFMLNLIYNLPAPLHVSFRLNIPGEWLTAYLCLVFLLGTLIMKRKAEPFAFV